MSARRRWLRRLLGGGGLGLLLGVVGIYVVVLWALPSAISYAPNAERPIDSAGDPSAGALHALGVSRGLRVAVGPPAASLSLWIVDPTGPARDTVLVLHGIRDNKRSQLGLGRALAAAGHRAVLVDLRGHGRSSGRFLSYGVIESRDLVQVIDALAERGSLTGEVKAVGASYGGAVALQLAARDRRVTAVATVATFTSLRDVTPLYLRRLVPGVGRLVTSGQIDEALERAGREAGFDPREAAPVRAVARTHARLLLVHGADDGNIPVSHARALHQAAGRRSQLLVIPGADHATVMGHPRVTRAVLDWL